MRYRLLAIDLDGTLLDRRGCVSEQNIAAIGRAREAGIRVVPCTGRAWRESHLVLRQLPGITDEDLGVFVTGAAVGCLANGQSLDMSVIEPNLAMAIVQSMYDLPEAVLVFRDANMVGHDYLVTGKGSLSANTQWWFQATGANVHYQRDITLDDLHHTLRVGAVSTSDRMAQIVPSLIRQFGDQVLIQSFQAVTKLDEAHPQETQTIEVLEIFAAGVDKWRGLTWIAQQDDIEANQIAAIGDQINDVNMLRSAGCGIAMANAVDAAAGAAGYRTGDCDQSGVAYAIDQLLSGRWT